MVAKKNTLLLLFLLSIMHGFNATAATISVKTDRSQVSLNESFQLIFEAEGSVDDDPNFSPLEATFQVLSTSQSSNFSVINGSIASAKRWTLTVMATAPGVQTIPSISFGRDVSQILQIDVRDLNNGSAGQQQDDIYLEASATPVDPYVQSQVIYTLKLYRSVAIAKASLTDPEITSGNAVLERLDDDKIFETTINGKAYQVIERNYAIYPQSSGEISIAPIKFMGQISRSRFGLEPFGAPPRTVVRLSQAINLNVRTVPVTFAGNDWLPAQNLTIAEEWSADPLTLRVGDPITRTLILTAKGLISSQLPELPIWEHAELKFYPDRPQLDDEKNDFGITSIRREKAAIIPNQPGNYVLPEVLIPWWNTNTDSLEQAVVPERVIKVLPPIGSNPVATDMTNLMQPLSEIVEVPLQDNSNVLLNEEPALPIDESSSLWKWSTILLVIVWFITLAMWRLNAKRDIRPQSTQIRTTKTNINLSIGKVTDACDQNDPVKVKESLLAWSHQMWPENPSLGISDIANRTDKILGGELVKLNQVLYSQSPETWKGDALKKAFADEVKRLSENKSLDTSEPGKLEPIFKIS
jgi:hypothetical protein